MDAYAVLGLRPGATKEEIKAQYRVMAKRWHPDKNDNDPEAQRIFKEVNRAYEFLMTTPKQRVSGRQNTEGQDPFGFANQRQWEDNLRKNFYDAFPQSKMYQEYMNKIKRMKKCHHCNGTGEIPA